MGTKWLRVDVITPARLLEKWVVTLKHEKFYCQIYSWQQMKLQMVVKRKSHSSASFHCAVNSIIESKIKTSSQTKGLRDASPKWVAVIRLPPVLFSFSHTYLTSAESKLDVWGYSLKTFLRFLSEMCVVSVHIVFPLIVSFSMTQRCSLLGVIWGVLSLLL